MSLNNLLEKVENRTFIDKEGIITNGVPCKKFLGALTKQGYGQVYDPETKGFILAHRLVAVVKLGMDNNDSSIEVCHHCDVRNCIEEKHLKIADKSWNMKDAYSKGRKVGFQKKTQCKNGHNLENHNVYFSPNDGRRRCRQCRTDAAERFRNKKYNE